MGLLEILQFACGLAFFLYGMKVISGSLEKLTGGKLESALKKMTGNRIVAMFLGAGITIAINSSSAVTVMLVGLVNSGIMQLGQTIGVIMGSNIGTTLTAWLLSLAGVKGDSVWVQLVQTENLAAILAVIGILLFLLCKKDQQKSVGSVMVGLGILLYGMHMITLAVDPLARSDGFKSILTAFNNPLLGVLAGAVFTFVIQSSTASVSILQALAIAGGVTYGMAIPIVMGFNIGTCMVALMSSIGVNRNAKRVAVVHISFNLLGTIICLALFYLGNWVVGFDFIDQNIGAVGVAVVHTAFNVFTTVLLLPFAGLLEKLANLIIRDKSEDETYSFIDRRLLATPSVAIAECDMKTAEMAGLAKDTLLTAIRLLKNYDDDKAETITKAEDQLDLYEDKLGTILVRLSSRELSDLDSRQVSKQLHTIGDFERIGDHAVNLMEVAQEIHRKNVQFSAEATAELNVLTAALEKILDLTFDSFCRQDIGLANKVEPLEQVIDQLIDEAKDRHIERLQTGRCTIQMGFILQDILNNYERISDHCSNIAVALIETNLNAYQTHEYLNVMKEAGDPEFESEYLAFRQQFRLQ